MERDERLPGEWIELPDALLYWEPDFVTDSAALWTELIEQAAWTQDHMRIQGRAVPLPRLTCWYGDAGATYTYSGIRMEPLPWLRSLEVLRQRLETHLSHRFNSVLLNYYRDGRDSMGYHSDDEAELGAEPVIATVSLGATRRFLLQRRQRRGAASHQGWGLDLTDASLLVMAGACQRHWRHAVPKTVRPVAGRISLTYRCVVAAAA